MTWYRWAASKKTAPNSSRRKRSKSRRHTAPSTKRNMKCSAGTLSIGSIITRSWRRSKGRKARRRNRRKREYFRITKSTVPNGTILRAESWITLKNEIWSSMDRLRGQIWWGRRWSERTAPLRLLVNSTLTVFKNSRKWATGGVSRQTIRSCCGITRRSFLWRIN